MASEDEELLVMALLLYSIVQKTNVKITNNTGPTLTCRHQVNVDTMSRNRGASGIVYVATHTKLPHAFPHSLLCISGVFISDAQWFQIVNRTESDGLCCNIIKKL